MKDAPDITISDNAEQLSLAALNKHSPKIFLIELDYSRQEGGIAADDRHLLSCEHNLTHRNLQPFPLLPPG